LAGTAEHHVAGFTSGSADGAGFALAIARVGVTPAAHTISPSGSCSAQAPGRLPSTQQGLPGASKLQSLRDSGPKSART